MFRDALIVDYGPTFLGHTWKVDDGIVCVVPVRAGRDPAVAAKMRKLVKAVGGDCSACKLCPLGRLS
jgi:hypothetical protein